MTGGRIGKKEGVEKGEGGREGESVGGDRVVRGLFTLVTVVRVVSSSK
jgi:hypothetical protein